MTSEHHQAGKLALEQLAGAVAAVGLERAVAVALEIADDDLPHDRLVVDDEDRLQRVNCARPLGVCKRRPLRLVPRAQSPRTAPNACRAARPGGRVEQGQE